MARKKKHQSWRDFVIPLFNCGKLFTSHGVLSLHLSTFIRPATLFRWFLSVSISNCIKVLSLFRCPAQRLCSQTNGSETVSNSGWTCLWYEECHLDCRYARDLHGGSGMEFCLREDLAASTITWRNCFSFVSEPT